MALEDEGSGSKGGVELQTHTDRSSVSPQRPLASSTRAEQITTSTESGNRRVVRNNLTQDATKVSPRPVKKEEVTPRKTRSGITQEVKDESDSDVEELDHVSPRKTRRSAAMEAAEARIMTRKASKDTPESGKKGKRQSMEEAAKIKTPGRPGRPPRAETPKETPTVKRNTCRQANVDEEEAVQEATPNTEKRRRGRPKRTVPVEEVSTEKKSPVKDDRSDMKPAVREILEAFEELEKSDEEIKQNPSDMPVLEKLQMEVHPTESEEPPILEEEGLVGKSPKKDPKKARGLAEIWGSKKRKKRRNIPHDNSHIDLDDDDDDDEDQEDIKEKKYTHVKVKPREEVRSRDSREAMIILEDQSAREQGEDDDVLPHSIFGQGSIISIQSVDGNHGNLINIPAEHQLQMEGDIDESHLPQKKRKLHRLLENEAKDIKPDDPYDVDMIIEYQDDMDDDVDDDYDDMDRPEAYNDVDTSAMDCKQLLDLAKQQLAYKSESVMIDRKPYKREHRVCCQFCDVRVKDYGYLFKHIKKLHMDHPGCNAALDHIRPLMKTHCPICYKEVSCISNISSHVKQCHAIEDTSVVCPSCKKTYKTFLSLRQHIRQCHQPEDKRYRYVCDICKSSFTEKRSLKEHINCTHETTQIFSCDECGKTFLTKGRLRRHKYIHGDFRHRCPHCNKGFHLRDNMNKHVEIIHEKKHGKRFKCPYCDKRFAVKGNMNQHVMAIHLKQYQYHCPVCNGGFRRKKEMFRHMELHKNAQWEREILEQNQQQIPTIIIENELVEEEIVKTEEPKMENDEELTTAAVTVPTPDNVVLVESGQEPEVNLVSGADIINGIVSGSVEVVSQAGTEVVNEASQDLEVPQVPPGPVTAEELQAATAAIEQAASGVETTVEEQTVVVSEAAAAAAVEEGGEEVTDFEIAEKEAVETLIGMKNARLNV